MSTYLAPLAPAVKKKMKDDVTAIARLTSNNPSCHALSTLELDLLRAIRATKKKPGFIFIFYHTSYDITATVAAVWRTFLPTEPAPALASAPSSAVLHTRPQMVLVPPSVPGHPPPKQLVDCAHYLSERTPRLPLLVALPLEDDSLHQMGMWDFKHLDLIADMASHSHQVVVWNQCDSFSSALAHSIFMLPADMMQLVRQKEDKTPAVKGRISIFPCSNIFIPEQIPTINNNRRIERFLVSMALRRALLLLRGVPYSGARANLAERHASGMLKTWYAFGHLKDTGFLPVPPEVLDREVSSVNPDGSISVKRVYFIEDLIANNDSLNALSRAASPIHIPVLSALSHVGEEGQYTSLWAAVERVTYFVISFDVNISFCTRLVIAVPEKQLESSPRAFSALSSASELSQSSLGTSARSIDTYSFDSVRGGDGMSSVSSRSLNDGKSTELSSLSSGFSMDSGSGASVASYHHHMNKESQQALAALKRDISKLSGARETTCTPLPDLLSSTMYIPGGDLFPPGRWLSRLQRGESAAMMDLSLPIQDSLQFFIPPNTVRQAALVRGLFGFFVTPDVLTHGEGTGADADNGDDALVVDDKLFDEGIESFAQLVHSCPPLLRTALTFAAGSDLCTNWLSSFLQMDALDNPLTRHPIMFGKKPIVLASALSPILGTLLDAFRIRSALELGRPLADITLSFTTTKPRNLMGREPSRLYRRGTSGHGHGRPRTGVAFVSPIPGTDPLYATILGMRLAGAVHDPRTDSVVHFNPEASMGFQGKTVVYASITVPAPVPTKAVSQGGASGPSVDGSDSKNGVSPGSHSSLSSVLSMTHIQPSAPSIRRRLTMEIPIPDFDKLPVRFVPPSALESKIGILGGHMPRLPERVVPLVEVPFKFSSALGGSVIQLRTSAQMDPQLWDLFGLKMSCDLL